MTETSGFVDFVHGQTPSLLRFAYMFSHDQGEAEDLVQEALTKLSGRWDHLGNLDYPEAYVRRVIVNQFLSWRRRLSSRELIGTAPERAVADPNDAVAERDVMWRLLGTLPRRQQVVLAMRYYEDLPDIDIGRVLECSAATVRSLAARALKTLRDSPQLQNLIGHDPSVGRVQEGEVP